MFQLSARPQLELDRRCSEGNIVTLYSNIDRDYTQHLDPNNGGLFSYYDRPIDIFRCNQPSCNCRRFDLKTQQDLKICIESKNNRSQRRGNTNYTNKHVATKCQYASYTDFVRQINYKIQNIDTEEYNKVYQKKIEMYNRIINFVEIERDWLQMKIDRKDLSLHLTEQQYCIFNKLKSGEEFIEFDEMEAMADYLSESSKQRFNQKCSYLQCDIVKTEEQIQKILEVVREDNRWEKQYINKWNWKLDKDIQDPQIAKFDERWREIITRTQEIKLCKDQIINRISTNNNKSQQIPLFFNLGEAISLELNFCMNNEHESNYEQNILLTNSFPNVKNVELIIKEFQTQKLEKLLWFNNLGSFKISGDQIKWDDLAPIWRVIRSNPSIKLLALSTYFDYSDLFLDNYYIEQLENCLSLPYLQQLDLSRNCIKMEKGLTFCQYYPNLRCLKLNNVYENRKTVQDREYLLQTVNYLKQEKDSKRPRSNEERRRYIRRRGGNLMRRNEQRRYRRDRDFEQNKVQRDISAFSYRLKARLQKLQREQRYDREQHNDRSEVKQIVRNLPSEQIYNFENQYKFAALKSITSLQSLHISNNDLNEADIANLCLFCPPQLISLNISDNPIKDAGVIMIIKAFLLLKSLFVSTCKITDKGFQAIALSPLQLTTFASRNNKVTDQSILLLLSNKPTLEHLDLQNVQFPKQVIRPTIQFRDYQDSQDFWISNYQLEKQLYQKIEKCSKAFIDIHKKLPKLKSLLTQVETPTGIFYLSKLKGLEQLKVTNTTKIDERVIMKVMLNMMRAKSEVNMRNHYADSERDERSEREISNKSKRNFALLEQIKKMKKKRQH